MVPSDMNYDLESEVNKASRSPIKPEEVEQEIKRYFSPLCSLTDSFVESLSKPLSPIILGMGNVGKTCLLTSYLLYLHSEFIIPISKLNSKPTKKPVFALDTDSYFRVMSLPINDTVLSLESDSYLHVTNSPMIEYELELALLSSLYSDSILYDLCESIVKCCSYLIFLLLVLFRQLKLLLSFLWLIIGIPNLGSDRHRFYGNAFRRCLI